MPVLSLSKWPDMILHRWAKPALRLMNHSGLMWLQPVSDQKQPPAAISPASP